MSREELRQTVETHRRFGYQSLHVILRRNGHALDRKRTQRLYHEERLAVRRRKNRQLALGARAPLATEAVANARWSADFAHDQFAGSRRFLNAIDDVTKESPAAMVGTPVASRWTVREMAALIERRSEPGVAVSGNGAKFTSNAVLEWRKRCR